MPTQIKENYLKAIFFLSQKNVEVSITELSNQINVSKPTANNMVNKMEKKGWVLYQKYKPLKLTAKGEKIGALIVRKHRLAEMFLSEVMGFGWEEVHDIAEEMEHLNSEIFFDRMDEILGFPTKDPHGSPIPDKNGKISKSNHINLTSIKEGENIVLCALANSSKELLLFLNKKKITLGTHLQVQQIESFDRSIVVGLQDNSQFVLTFDVCKCLLVKRM